jgi:hypothetical protein
LVNPLDVKFLARPDAVLLAEFGRQDNLAFAGNGRCHTR